MSTLFCYKSALISEHISNSHLSLKFLQLDKNKFLQAKYKSSRGGKNDSRHSYKFSKSDKNYQLQIINNYNKMRRFFHESFASLPSWKKTYKLNVFFHDLVKFDLSHTEIILILSLHVLSTDISVHANYRHESIRLTNWHPLTLYWANRKQKKYKENIIF